jgi:GDP-L-fucose synthase
LSLLITPADRIFVAGHRGMAGSAICRALQRAGYGDPAHGGALLTALRSELDLREAQAVQRWFSEHQPTVVVLAAANSAYPVDFLLDNLKIQTAVIETAWRSGMRRLLFLGSSCIHPKFAEQPIKEEALLTGELEPANEWYAIAKIAGLKLCAALRKQHGIDVISLMPTNLYGPGDNYHPTHSHVLPALIRRFHERPPKPRHRASPAGARARPCGNSCMWMIWAKPACLPSSTGSPGLRRCNTSTWALAWI